MNTGPAVDADPHREGRAGLDDVAEREQHSLFVVTHHPRGARAQPDLDAVVGDVRIEEAHLVAFDRLLHQLHELVESPPRARGPLARDHLIEAAEVEERDRGGAMLGGRRPSEQMRSDGDWQEPLDHLLGWCG